MTDTSNTTAATPQLIDVERLVQITGLSKPTLWRHHAAGLIPLGMKIGRAVRWRLADINRWIESGCPHRDESNRNEQVSLSQSEGVHHGE